jgi:hypothetical protein
MATNYTGVATATQAPSAAPEPGSAPVVVLPADGDPLNAASVAQSKKVLADYIAWMLSPRAKASSWLQALRRYRNARLQTVSAVDHLGFPAGRFVGWDEDWSNLALTSKGNTDPDSGAWAGRWDYGLPGAGTLNASIAVAAPHVTSFPASRFVQMAVAAATNADAHVESSKGETISDANRAIAFQWMAKNHVPAELGTCEVAMGVSIDDANAADTGTFSSIASPGAAFVKRTSDTNWQCYTKAIGGSAAYADSGVAGNTNAIRRFRVEVIGANVADDSTARVNFFVDDTHVGVVLVVGAGIARPFFRLSRSSSGSNACDLFIGAANWRHNLLASDVVL